MYCWLVACQLLWLVGCGWFAYGDLGLGLLRLLAICCVCFRFGWLVCLALVTAVVYWLY